MLGAEIHGVAVYGDLAAGAGGLQHFGDIGGHQIGRAEKEARPSFLKKRSKKLLSISVRARPEGRTQFVKVLWFFLSRKNAFLFIMT
jgi:hypothetical protein